MATDSGNRDWRDCLVGEGSICCARTLTLLDYCVVSTQRRIALAWPATTTTKTMYVSVVSAAMLLSPPLPPTRCNESWQGSETAAPADRERAAVQWRLARDAVRCEGRQRAGTRLDDVDDCGRLVGDGMDTAGPVVHTPSSRAHVHGHSRSRCMHCDRCGVWTNHQPAAWELGSGRGMHRCFTARSQGEDEVRSGDGDGEAEVQRGKRKKKEL